ncbi:MAG: YqiJ family protein [Anaerolineae bacterium]|nr:YqiJ family protein [Anaerolineae bacterium]
MELLFLGIMLTGLLYLLLMIFSGIGEVADFGIDGALESTGLDAVFGLDLDAGDTGEVSGLGCSVIAAFLAGFGVVGLVGSLLHWSLLLIILCAVAFGLLVGRLVVRILRFVYSQQSTEVYSAQDLVGSSGRVTINSGAGQTGEVLIESGQILKYPIKEVSGAELKRGDTVEVVAVQGRFLHVKKKRV